MLNKVSLIGNLGGDPELRYTGAGTPVGNFRIATNEFFTDKNGEKQKRTEWHRITVWGKLAEVVGEHLKKGRLVYVEGKLQTRQWEDREGVKRYTTEINASEVKFLPSGAANGKRTPGDEQGEQEGFDYGPPPADDQDVPF